ncbi:MAG: metalloregulator ArsR/SmtB family transcription factor [Bradymonadales bacterium]|nr:metalloregulator ArsR/SmtB family transcription factor [Bradymonadales bacterium]
MRTLAAVFKALSDETRLSMLGLLLREGELCVCDFVEVLGVTQSKASRHLHYLVNAGLLQDRREAVWVYFRIAENPGVLLSAVLSSLRELLPQHIPAELLDALETWRKSRAKDCTACKPLAARGRAGGGRP